MTFYGVCLKEALDSKGFNISRKKNNTWNTNLVTIEIQMGSSDNVKP